MSSWKQVKPEDIELDGDELNILYSTDEQGNNYLVLKLSDIPIPEADHER